MVAIAATAIITLVILMETLLPSCSLTSNAHRKVDNGPEGTACERLAACESRAMDIYETPLPGIGVRYEFTAESGDHIGVIVRRDGRRDVALYDRADPDACKGTMELSEGDASKVAELLGGTNITARLDSLRHMVEGLAIEWVSMPSTGGLTGKTIGDGHIRTATSASVVAVIRGEHGIPGPGPDFTFEPGDTVLVMGGTESVREAREILTG